MEGQSSESEWLKKHSQRIKSAPNIVILGLGQGLHVVKAIEKFPRKNIFVLDENKDSISFFKKKYPFDAQKITIIKINSINDVMNSKPLAAALKDLFIVLEYTPVTQQMAVFYKEIKQTILFRNWNGLQWAGKVRGVLGIEFRREVARYSAKNQVGIENPIGFKELKSLINETGFSRQRDQMIWNALLELTE